MQLTVDKRKEKMTFKKVVPYGNSFEMNQYISRLSNRKCTISFSCGKDSIAMWLYMVELGMWDEIVPVYYYVVPDLEFVEESLVYYEKFFGTKIIRVPSPNLYGAWRTGVLQTPETFHTVLALRDTIIKCNFDDCDRWVREDLGMQENWCGTGVRKFDGLIRLSLVNTGGGIKEQEKKFMPVFDFKIQDVADIIKKHNCKTPSDYQTWGKSFDGIDYRFIIKLKKDFPRDYQKMVDCFPLLEVNIMRYNLENQNVILQP